MTEETRRPSLPAEDAFFLSRLSMPDATPLKEEYKLFIATFKNRKLTLSEQRKSISIFLDQIYAASLENSVFSNVTDDDELEYIREGWEKLIMRGVYTLVFSIPGSDDFKMQKHLNNKISLFGWVKERHFDIPYTFGQELAVAQDELYKINGFQSPKEKLAVLMKVFDLAVAAIKSKQDSAGNDQLLPVIILTIMRSKAPDVICNVNYILRFRSRHYVEPGQVQYCLTTMMSAISFIYNLTLESLTITPAESEQYRAILPAPYISASKSSSSTSTGKPNATSVATAGGITRPKTHLPGSQSHASAFINNNQATVAINDFASSFFSGTVKVLGNAGSVLKSAAETVGGTVDGFTQGLIAGFKEDGTGPVGVAGGAQAGSSGSLDEKRDTGGSGNLVQIDQAPLTAVDKGKAPMLVGNASPSATSAPVTIINSDRSSVDGVAQSHAAWGEAGAPPTLISQSPSTKAGTAFAMSLKASRQAAVKLFTPVSGMLTSQSVFGPGSGRSTPMVPGSAGTSYTGADEDGQELPYRPPTKFPPRTTSAAAGHAIDGGADESFSRAGFEHRLSNAEKYVLEDYEMQLALALSLSEAGSGERKADLIDFDGPVDEATNGKRGGLGVAEYSLTIEDDEEEEDEVPLQSRRNKAEVDSHAQKPQPE
ncbi:hypothetical protein HDU77_003310 [Chytriomyces hyalinus]|nr:hypothetical protein HDU77_003310 [Chytriomyces hyalinus]